jgi:hypothetical protein
MSEYPSTIDVIVTYYLDPTTNRYYYYDYDRGQSVWAASSTEVETPRNDMPEKPSYAKRLVAAYVMKQYISGAITQGIKNAK